MAGYTACLVTHGASPHASPCLEASLVLLGGLASAQVMMLWRVHGLGCSMVADGPGENSPQPRVHLHPGCMYTYICVTQIAAFALLVKDFTAEAENLCLCGERLVEGILVSALTSAAWLRCTEPALHNAAFQQDPQNGLCASLCEPSCVREKLPWRLQAVLHALKWLPPVPGVISLPLTSAEPR